MIETVTESDLRQFTIDVFRAIECSDAHARLAADVLITSDLRGIDSHGVARLKGYLRLYEQGRINTKPNIKVLHERISTAAIDGDSGLQEVHDQR
jgi:LDH2 family malate/lactate/ureidoglycolate dehydrogenase